MDDKDLQEEDLIDNDFIKVLKKNTESGHLISEGKMSEASMSEYKSYHKHKTNIDLGSKKLRSQTKK